MSRPRARHVRLVALLAAGLLAAPTAARAGSSAERGGGRDGLRAGAAVLDATWHVGSSAGQYASDGTAIHVDPDGVVRVDPAAHSTRRVPSYGIESRSSVRALVVEGADGERAAVVSADLYIPQQLLWSRVATILEARDEAVRANRAPGPLTGITQDRLAFTVTHSHTAPYLSTPSWGVWLFQDAFDLRFFEWYAQRAAEAVVEATRRLAPARVGAHRVSVQDLKRNSMGPGLADDQTPAGYPQTHNDPSVEVIAFDEARPGGRPIATWVVYGLHPEMLSGNNLLSGEYVNVALRTVDRALGGGHVTLFSQSDVGASEPGRDALAQPPELRAEYSHREYAQMKRAGLRLAGAVLAARQVLAGGAGRVPWQRNPAVAMRTEWFAPPGVRPTPTVSNCRADAVVEGDPRLPLLGFPDCVSPAREAGVPPPAVPSELKVTLSALRTMGVPLPDNVGFPSLTGLQESIAVPLQALRLGRVGVTICPCEEFSDQAWNIKHRLERAPDALPVPLVPPDWRGGQTPWGFDWTSARTPQGRPWCVPEPPDRWRCADPRNPSRDLAPVPAAAIDRMRAQVLNDAAGWDAPEGALAAESEPGDPAAIHGNFTHERLVGSAGFGGYDLVAAVSMANDYWGYIVTYREFQRGDHYRKALTGLGPHAADFLATRLARMAASLAAGSIQVPRTAKDDVYAAAGPAHIRALAVTLGQLAARWVPVFEAQLPADGGQPEIVRQPDDLERFGAAAVTWVGGSNVFDTPEVTVERLVGGRFVPFGDTSGEVQLRVTYPSVEELALWRAGGFRWRWTATFEAFSSDVETMDLQGERHWATPAGTYRFVIDGRRHVGAGRTEPYRLVSRPFRVEPWRGIIVEATRVVPDGVLVEVGPASEHRYGVPTDPYLVGPIDYPDSYASPFPFISGQRRLATYGLADPRRHQQFCFACSFQPWRDAGAPVAVAVTVVGPGGARRIVPARPVGDGSGRQWLAPVRLVRGARALVEAGGVRDRDGNTNGRPGPVVVGD